MLSEDMKLSGFHGRCEIARATSVHRVWRGFIWDACCLSPTSLKGPDRMGCKAGGFRHRLVFLVLLSLPAVVASCGGSGPTGQAVAKVHTLVDRLGSHDLRCRDLVVKEVEPGKKQGGSVLGVRPGAPHASAVGFCRLPGAPIVRGHPLSTMILVFKDRRHLKFLPPRHVLFHQVLVYGDRWEVFVTPPRLARPVQAALGGKIL